MDEKKIVENVLHDVKNTMLVVAVYNEYCNDWECQKLGEYVDKIINYVAKKYEVEVRGILNCDEEEVRGECPWLSSYTRAIRSEEK